MAKEWGKKRIEGREVFYMREKELEYQVRWQRICEMVEEKDVREIEDEWDFL